MPTLSRVKKVANENKSSQANWLVDESELFSAIFEERTVQIAHNAGFENYRDYAFRRRERFVVPLMRQIQERRRHEMSLKLLRPWDLAVDGRPPLRPCAHAIARRRREHLERVLTLLSWVAKIDAFQTRQQREDYWVELHKRFGGIESWEGYEEALRAQHWQRQLHLYTAPFYYIEYGIAQLGALGIWEQAQKDRQKAVQAYKRALAVGGARPLPELFKAAGLPFDFGKEAIARVVESLRTALD